MTMPSRQHNKKRIAFRLSSKNQVILLCFYAFSAIAACAAASLAIGTLNGEQDT